MTKCNKWNFIFNSCLNYSNGKEDTRGKVEMKSFVVNNQICELKRIMNQPDEQSNSIVGDIIEYDANLLVINKV